MLVYPYVTHVCFYLNEYIVIYNNFSMTQPVLYGILKFDSSQHKNYKLYITIYTHNKINKKNK